MLKAERFVKCGRYLLRAICARRDCWGFFAAGKTIVQSEKYEFFVLLHFYIFEELFESEMADLQKMMVAHRGIEPLFQG